MNTIDHEQTPGQPMPHLVFLLYDSRSGSTYFSRQLHNVCDSLVVTPEISLLYALRALRRGERDPVSIKSALVKGRFFSSLGVSENTFPEDQQVVTNQEFASFIRQSLATFASVNWPNRDVSDVVIKKGHHVSEAEFIVKIFPEARFLCLYRDPRSVYESKKRTTRPYRPNEKMGWAGTALTSYRWCQYSDSMILVERDLPALRVQFEDLSADTNTVLARVLAFLGLKRIEKPADDYSINETEQLIHSRSVSDMHESGKVWIDKLSIREIKIVELVSRRQMNELDYVASTCVSLNGYLFVIFSGASGVLKLARRWFKEKLPHTKPPQI